MSIDRFTFEQREAEQARTDERNERYARFCPPSVLPSPKTLWAQMLERFEIIRSLSGGIRVTNERPT